MKKVIAGLMVGVLVVLAVMASSASAAAPDIEWTNAPKDGVIVLHVGESYTLDLEVNSDTEFLRAQAMPTQYYPGRGIFYSGSDRAGRGTSATLHLTVTGKEPTDSLPGGYAPASAIVGVHVQKGDVVTEQFDFQVIVLP